LCNLKHEIHQISLGKKSDDIEIEVGHDAEVFDIYEAVVVTASQLDIVIEEPFEIVFLVDGGHLAPSSDSRHHKLHQVLVVPLVLHLQDHAFHY
jgi:hypothetical protein